MLDLIGLGLVLFGLQVDYLVNSDAAEYVVASAHAPRDVRLIGVVPQWIATCPHLSDVARRAVPIAMEHVVRELEHLGLHPQPKPLPHVPSIWWEEARV